MKRLFLAIPLQGDETQRLAAYLQPYKTEPILADAKWVEPKNFHITTLFLGAVPDSVLPEMLEILRGTCARIHPFELHYESILFFPFKFPKMIWARFHKSFEFTELAGELRRFLAPYMEESEEEKDPVPHLTLAKLKNPIDARKFGFKTYKMDVLRVTELHLYESQANPKGLLSKNVATGHTNISQDGAAYTLIEKLSLSTNA